MPYVNQRWLGGMLTNFQTVHQRINRLKELDEIDFDDVAGSGRTKKELLQLKRERDKLDKTLGGIREMTRTPAAVWVVDTKKEHLAVEEARKLRIPIIGILDTNCDPDEVDFPIPGNDDAIRAVGLLTRVVADAVAEGLIARSGVAHRRRRGRRGAAGRVGARAAGADDATTAAAAAEAAGEAPAAEAAVPEEAVAEAAVAEEAVAEAAVAEEACGRGCRSRRRPCRGSEAEAPAARRPRWPRRPPPWRRRGRRGARRRGSGRREPAAEDARRRGVRRRGAGRRASRPPRSRPPRPTPTA